MSALALALAGGVLLWVPAFRFRIDAATCATWPAGAAGAGYALAYAAAVALLAAAWLRALESEWSLRRALAYGALVHAVAIVAPPFASNDPLFYAAIGRAMARFGATAATPLSSVLPAGDHFLAVLPESWRAGTSPYGGILNLVARAVARWGGDDLTLQLRAYQALNVGVLVATAAVAGRAFGARAATLVLFAPLAIVDGSVNPHNDALVALPVAAFALALARRREGAALAALLVALAVKLSAALLLAFDLLRLALRPLATRLRGSHVLAAGAGVAALAVAAIVIAPRHWPALYAFTALVGDPHEQYPHISRSVEALPRAFLFYILHAATASWALGLVFRAGAAVWILWCAFRAAATGEPLRWAASALFGYYLFLHAFLQSWYLLPLLPLATQLPAHAQAAFRVFVVGLTAYYALSLPLDCTFAPAIIGAKEFTEAAIVILPAAFTLLVSWRRRDRASAETSRPAA
jgi:Glycosyltransferase family 87